MTLRRTGLKRGKARRKADRREFLAEMAALTGARPPDPEPERAPRVAPDVRAVVLARARYRCERCGRDVAAGGCDVHHRRPAGSGGSTAAATHEASNLVLVCVDCHRWAESNRAEALRVGWLVRQSADPAAVPVPVFGAGVVFLHPHEPRYITDRERLAQMCPEA